MALQYVYSDNYLKNLVSQSDEDMAIADVKATDPNFSDSDLEGIVPFRAYIYCCISNVKSIDDPFGVRKGYYEKELAAAIEIARTRNKAGVPQSVFSIAIGRA
jgi:hypothetical protein